MSDRKKAIVVDDDKKTIMLVETILAPLGYDVLSAEEGKKALAMVKAEKPNLFICDLLLPGIHGVELVNMIKGDPELEQVKVIAISAVYRQANYRLGFDCRADAFIEKPFAMDELERLIHKIEKQ
jgi:CheY-like chemotaxis protein